MNEYQELFVAIAVRQWEPMVQFYHYTLAQSPTIHRPNAYAEFKVRGLKLGLFLPQEDHQAEFSQPEQAAISLCLEVRNLEHSRSKIDAVYNELAKTGNGEGEAHCRYGDIAIAPHGCECYAYDPDGNRLILYEAVAGQA